MTDLRVHRAETDLDPIRDSRFSRQSYAQLRLLSVSILIHELYHAYLSIFVEREVIFIEDRLRALGVDELNIEANLMRHRRLRHNSQD